MAVEHQTVQSILLRVQIQSCIAFLHSQKTDVDQCLFILKQFKMNTLTMVRPKRVEWLNRNTKSTVESHCKFGHARNFQKDIVMQSCRPNETILSMIRRRKFPPTFTQELDQSERRSLQAIASSHKSPGQTESQPTTALDWTSSTELHHLLQQVFTATRPIRSIGRGVTE